ncbi:MAG: sigma-70 family RNA polymerase sigma factor [Phycisphaeraceae bacterium]|nr:sigma-70 family RNA polymerase sigma factor [Phycisphaeraceae bacterium]
MDRPHAHTTVLLTRIVHGDPRAADELLPLLYDEIRGAAGRLLANAEPCTLQPTALVNEAYLKLAGHADDLSRSHFFALAARAMRQVLIDHARAGHALKRGGGHRHIPLADSVSMSEREEVDSAAIDRALTRLASHDQRAARVVELKFYSGLTNPQIAQVLGVARSTVSDDWAHARAWLRRQLASGDGG